MNISLYYLTLTCILRLLRQQLFGDMHADDTRAFYYKGAQEMDCMREEKNRMFIMELILHCSDISNPYKPYKISARWADLVVEEFCRQGDREKSEGLEISPMCDRDNINLCNMQMGFIEFVVSPLIGGKIELMSMISCIMILPLQFNYPFS